MLAAEADQMLRENRGAGDDGVDVPAPPVPEVVGVHVGEPQDQADTAAGEHAARRPHELSGLAERDHHVDHRRGEDRDEDVEHRHPKTQGGDPDGVDGEDRGRGVETGVAQRRQHDGYAAGAEAQRRSGGRHVGRRLETPRPPCFPQAGVTTTAPGPAKRTDPPDTATRWVGLTHCSAVEWTARSSASRRMTSGDRTAASVERSTPSRMRLPRTRFTASLAGTCWARASTSSCSNISTMSSTRATVAASGIGSSMKTTVRMWRGRVSIRCRRVGWCTNTVGPAYLPPSTANTITWPSPDRSDSWRDEYGRSR